MPKEPLAIRTRGLCKRYHEGAHEHVVLDGVDLDIRHGETVALRGRSGSGKSTLLNLVGGIDAPDAGSVAVAGIELTDLTERERTLFRRQHIGFVYQAFNLVPTLNVADNVRLVLELNNVPKADIAPRIGELLDAVDLGDRAASSPDVLSGGEQQRVAIARAIVKQPEVLLCDEPTGALDSKTGIIVLEALSRINAELGTTTAIITHNAPIQRMAHRVFMFHDGRIAETHVNDERLAASEMSW